MTVRRQSFEVDSIGHVNPIATVSRIGPLVTCSIINPKNPGTDEIPADLDTQIANLFHHVGEMLAVVGGTWDHIAKMTFYVRELSVRAAINPHWVQRFPDPARLPSRHSMLAQIDGAADVQCDFTAYID